MNDNRNETRLSDGLPAVAVAVAVAVAREGRHHFWLESVLMGEV